MPAPLVSVVVPCHNAGAWIAETIGSVVAQRDVPLEIVLVDDGSSDDSVSQAATAAADAPLVVIEQSQLGASRARTVGTHAARGAHIQYLDADDVLQPGTLQARLEALLRTGGDVAYCDWVRWEGRPDGTFRDGEVVQRRMKGRPDIAILRGAWWPPGALLYRREVVDAVLPWREDLPIIQDARFLLDVALGGARFVHVDHVGVRYRTHPDSLSRRDGRAFFEDCYHNAVDVQATLERDGSLDGERHASLVALYAYLAREYFRRDRVRFDEVVRRLKALDPDFVPAGPPAFRAVSRVVGYPASEYVAAVWHAFKRAARQMTTEQKAM